MPNPLTLLQIAELQRIDTPTVCNLLEIAAPHRRGHGYTTRHLHCAFPDLPPIVGYAKTATIRAREPGPLSGADNLAMRFGYYDYVVDGPAPRISVIQDLDDHQPGYGSIYPVAPAILPALAKLLGFHPWIGIWLGAGLMCALVCWMLQGWVPPKWAFLGGLLAVGRFT